MAASTDLRSLDGFKRLVIREQNGALVRLEDVADVELGADEYDQDVRFSGQKAVFMGVWVLPSASALDVIGDVNEEIKQISAELPSGMQAKVAYDSTAYIKDAIHEVVKTLSETVLIVMLVIFLFLGSFRSALVPVVAIPVSLIGGVFLMQAFGFTLNLLTLLAIVLSVGLVVDDAIVVVENVERHIREGRTPYHAALLGARELVGPDHRHDHHAGGGVRPDRHPGRADRRAVPRVRVHAGGRGLHLGGRGADAVAGDVVAPAARPSTSTAGSRARSKARSTPSGRATRRMLAGDAALPPGGVRRLDRPVAAAGAALPCSRRASWRRTRIRASCSARSTSPPTRRWSR